MGDSIKKAESRSMTLLQRGREALEAPPTHTELVLRLHSVIKDALASGITREQMAADLQRLRVANPEHDDVILDALDFLSGWSSPHMALP